MSSANSMAANPREMHNTKKHFTKLTWQVLCILGFCQFCYTMISHYGNIGSPDDASISTSVSSAVRLLESAPESPAWISKSNKIIR